MADLVQTFFPRNYLSVSKGFLIGSPDLEDIQDYDVRNQILDIQSAQDLKSVQEAANRASTLIGLCGCSPYIPLLDKKQAVVDVISKFYSVYRVQPAFDQLMEGLQTCELLSYLQKDAALFHEVFCKQKTVISADIVKRLFRTQSSEVGSNPKRTEDRVLGYWWEYLQDCEGKKL